MSQLSCFLEMLVQLRSRATGCLRMMPLSMRGVMDLHRLRLMCFQSLLSQHLVRDAADSFIGTLRDEVWRTRFQLHGTCCTHHLFQVLQTRMQTHRSL